MSLKKHSSEVCISPDGKEYVRVSAILETSKKLGRKRIKSGMKIKDVRYHAAVGMIVHENIRRLFQGKDFLKMPPLAKRKIQQIQLWKGQYFSSALLEPETTLYDEKGFAGSPDLACIIKDEPYAVDFKTGCNIRDYDLMQIEAYGYLLDQHFPGQVFRRAIVQVFENQFIFHTFERDQKRQESFMKLLDEWKKKSEEIQSHTTA